MESMFYGVWYCIWGQHMAIQRGWDCGGDRKLLRHRFLGYYWHRFRTSWDFNRVYSEPTVPVGLSTPSFSPPFLALTSWSSLTKFVWHQNSHAQNLLRKCGHDNQANIIRKSISSLLYPINLQPVLYEVFKQNTSLYIYWSQTHLPSCQELRIAPTPPPANRWIFPYFRIYIASCKPTASQSNHASILVDILVFIDCLLLSISTSLSFTLYLYYH